MLCIFWGTTWFAMKVTLNYGTPPLLSAGLRFLIGSIFLWSFFWYKKSTLPLDKIALRLYFQFAILNFGISYSLTYWATQYIYSNLSAIIWAGFPSVVAILSYWMLPEEPLTRKRIISIVLGTIGVIIIIANSGSLGGENVVLGIIVVSLSVLIAAYPNVYLKKHHSTVKPLTLNAVSQSIAGVTLLALSLLFESSEKTQWVLPNWTAIIYLAIFGSAVSWSIYFWLFSHISMTQISYIALIPPVIATIIGWIFLGEELNGLVIFGSALVLSGALIVNYRSRKKKPEEVVH